LCRRVIIEAAHDTGFIEELTGEPGLNGRAARIAHRRRAQLTGNGCGE
jgi:hypothetical protein